MRRSASTSSVLARRASRGFPGCLLFSSSGWFCVPRVGGGGGGGGGGWCCFGLCFESIPSITE